jgi:uncharacterized protein YjbI with pentapeptide repeats
MRKPYEESCRTLVERGVIDDVPSLKPRTPSYDDEEPLGLSFFRTHLEDEDLSALSLPRTFFGRSLIARCLWIDTDLSESCLCWNDFEDSDFSRALLTHADLRAANFERCNFDGADLTGADLRRSSFDECSFNGAKMSQARVTDEQLARLPLDPLQRDAVVVEDEGDEPPGG